MEAGADDGKVPSNILWNITYACPLRCEFCFTESGRRPSRHGKAEQTLDLARAIANQFAPKEVVIAGGEPLILPYLIEAADILRAAGAKVSLYTSGFGLTRELARELVRVFATITVSIDAPTAELHDSLRGRAGAFQAAIDGLHTLDELVGDPPTFTFGVDCTVIRANFGHVGAMVDLVREVAPRAGYLGLEAAVPGGLASRESYAKSELMSEEQYAQFRDGSLEASFRDLRNPRVYASANWDLLLQANGVLTKDLLTVEPDGEVLAMLNYEGTVGNVFVDGPVEIWKRARERWRDPFVVEALAPVRTLEEWAAAVRRIDLRFAKATELVRLTRRV
jgi:MoaA/NifB/PqqE/SkfB family radical SAM enzyme